MASTSMPVRDAGANLVNVAQEVDTNGVRTPRQVPEVAGAAVSSQNPLPVAGTVQVQAQTALPISAPNDLPTRPNVNISLTQTVVTLTAGVSAQLVAAKSNRRYLGIVNIGTAAASLGVGAAAVLNQGWPLVAADSLGAQGGALLWESNAVPTQAFYAIASAGTTIIVLEG